MMYNKNMGRFTYSWRRTRSNSKDEVVEMSSSIISLIGTAIAYREHIFKNLLDKIDQTTKVIIFVVLAWITYFVLKFLCYFILELFRGESVLKLEVDCKSPPQKYTSKWVNIRITNHSKFEFKNCGIKLDRITEKGKKRNLLIRDELIVWPGYGFGRRTIEPGDTHFQEAALAFTKSDENKIIFSVQQDQSVYERFDIGKYFVDLIIEGDYLDEFERYDVRILIDYQGNDKVECKMLEVNKLKNKKYKVCNVKG